VRLQVSSPKPGRRARGEGTRKVSVRQGRGHAGALPTALRAHRISITHLCRMQVLRGMRALPTRGGSANSVLPPRSPRGLVLSDVRVEGRQVKPASCLGTRSHFLTVFTPTAGA
jgi:hypothetical protein